MLETLARWSYRSRRLMVLLWVIALVAFIALGSAFGGDYKEDFSLPGAESQEALDLLKDKFPAFAGDTASIVFEAEEGVVDPAVQQEIEALLAEISDVEHVIGIESPYSEEGQGQISQDGTIAFATIRFENLGNEAIPIEIGKEINAMAADTELDGLTVEAGGNVIAFSEFQNPEGAEGIGMLFAIVILLITFGSVLAAGLPIMTALFGIAIGLSLVFLFANFLNVPEFTPQLAMMIGIGVGIDYALFIVTRYRQFLHEGWEPERAVVGSITTSGKAVLFAGTTVVIGLLGMLLMGFAFVEGVGVGAAAAVAVTMIASVTLLPAVLGFVGSNIDRWRIPMFHRSETGQERNIWYRWSRVIQRRPWPAFLAGLLVLVVLAIPVFSLRLGFADAGTSSPERSSRRAYDILARGFGPGFNGPLLFVAEVNGPEDMEALGALGETLANTDGVAAVSPPIPNEAGDAAVMNAFPSTSPQSEQTTELVKRLRSDVIPSVTSGSDTDIVIGGLTAAIVDFSDANGDRLPLLLSVVIGLSFLILVVVFRSLLVPLKAAIMNLLSIAAAYGVLVAVFQWGWGMKLIGVQGTAPIEAWAPMMLFTVLFGLSMDYEIFLLSRIREEYVKTGDNATAVANGLANTARVITAAAAIMVTLFLAFVFGFEERAIKLFGLGLAVAIFVDATIVRMVLVPATMELLGNANWWLPKWLDRILPQVHIEGKTIDLTPPDDDTEISIPDPAPARSP